MKIFSYLALLLMAASPVRGQSANSTGSTGGNAVNTNDAAKNRAKPKKIWTNDEIAGAGGEGAISVVGKEPEGAKPQRNNTPSSGQGPVRDKQIAAWRARLRQLQSLIELADQRIEELRNFKGDNGSVYGGIVLSHRYSMTPVDEQIRTQEERKKSLRAEMDAIEEQARKGGVEPGQLR